MFVLVWDPIHIQILRYMCQHLKHNFLVKLQNCFNFKIIKFDVYGYGVGRSRILL